MGAAVSQPYPNPSKAEHFPPGWQAKEQNALGGSPLPGPSGVDAYSKKRLSQAAANRQSCPAQVSKLQELKLVKQELMQCSIGTEMVESLRKRLTKPRVVVRADSGGSQESSMFRCGLSGCLRHQVLRFRGIGWHWKTTEFGGEQSGLDLRTYSNFGAGEEVCSTRTMTVKH